MTLVMLPAEIVSLFVTCRNCYSEKVDPHVLDQMLKALDIEMWSGLAFLNERKYKLQGRTLEDLCLT